MCYNAWYIFCKYCLKNRALYLPTTSFSVIFVCCLIRFQTKVAKVAAALFIFFYKCTFLFCPFEIDRLAVTRLMWKVAKLQKWLKQFWVLLPLIHKTWLIFQNYSKEKFFLIRPRKPNRIHFLKISHKVAFMVEFFVILAISFHEFFVILMKCTPLYCIQIDLPSLVFYFFVAKRSFRPAVGIICIQNRFKWWYISLPLYEILCTQIEFTHFRIATLTIFQLNIFLL